MGQSTDLRRQRRLAGLYYWRRLTLHLVHAWRWWEVLDFQLGAEFARDD
jgi:hypothetical protein